MGNRNRFKSWTLSPFCANSKNFHIPMLMIQNRAYPVWATTVPWPIYLPVLPSSCLCIPYSQNRTACRKEHSHSPWTFSLFYQLNHKNTLVKAKTQNTCVSCLKSDPASLVSRTVFSSRPSLLVRDLSLSRLSLSLSRSSLSFSHSGNGIGTGASSTCSLLSVFLTLIFSSSCCNFLFAA